MLKSTVFVAAAMVMIDRGVLATRPQDPGLATPDIGQTSRVLLDNPPPVPTKSNYARDLAQDWHPDHHPSSPRDPSTRSLSADMHASASGGHATTSDVEMLSDMLGSSIEGSHSPQKRSTTSQESLSATRAFGSYVHPFAERNPQSAFGRFHSISPSPVSEHPLPTLRILNADDYSDSHQFNKQSIALTCLHLSAADMASLTTLSTSIAATVLGGILAATFLFGTAAMTQQDIKLSPSARAQITQAEQRCLDGRVRLCQRPGFVGDNVGTMAVF